MLKYKVFLAPLLLALINTASADNTHPGITTELVIRSPNDWSGDRLPPYLLDAPEIALMKYIIPPQTALPVHQHPSINAAYVMSGEVIARGSSTVPSSRVKLPVVNSLPINNLSTNHLISEVLN